MNRRHALMAGVAITAAATGARWSWWQRSKAAPDNHLWSLQFDTPAGAAMQVGAFRGKPLLLNFWATWCAPCVKEMPTLDAIAEDYDGKLRVLTASQDLEGAGKVVPFFKDKKFAHLEPWLDRDNALSSALGGDGVLPTTVIYDASGQEVARVVGGFDWQSAEAKALVDEVVAPSA